MVILAELEQRELLTSYLFFLDCLGFLGFLAAFAGLAAFFPAPFGPFRAGVHFLRRLSF